MRARVCACVCMYVWKRERQDGEGTRGTELGGGRGNRGGAGIDHLRPAPGNIKLNKRSIFCSLFLSRLELRYFATLSPPSAPQSFSFAPADPLSTTSAAAAAADRSPSVPPPFLLRFFLFFAGFPRPLTFPGNRYLLLFFSSHSVPPFAARPTACRPPRPLPPATADGSTVRSPPRQPPEPPTDPPLHVSLFVSPSRPCVETSRAEERHSIKVEYVWLGLFFTLGGVQIVKSILPPKFRMPPPGDADAHTGLFPTVLPFSASAGISRERAARGKPGERERGSERKRERRDWGWRGKRRRYAPRADDAASSRRKTKDESRQGRKRDRLIAPASTARHLIACAPRQRRSRFARDRTIHTGERFFHFRDSGSTLNSLR